MIKVIIESPYAGTDSEVKEHEDYLNLCILDSISRAEAPFASHRMYTEALDDTCPAERKVGIQCGFAWWDVADKVVFYTDHGMSPGMENALDLAIDTGKHWEERCLKNKK